MDLLSSELRQRRAAAASAAATAPAASATAADYTGEQQQRCVYAWGSGSNYQLGTGYDTASQEAPVRVEALQGVQATALAAAKYHSAALAEDGRVFTWGWGRGAPAAGPAEQLACCLLPARYCMAAALHLMKPLFAFNALCLLELHSVWRQQYASRMAAPLRSRSQSSDPLVKQLLSHFASPLSSRAGGRLGHPDFDIHSGQVAQILPRPVAALGRRVVVSLAAAKHHMLAATSAGEVFTWVRTDRRRLHWKLLSALCHDRRVVSYGLSVACLTTCACLQQMTAPPFATSAPSPTQYC